MTSTPTPQDQTRAASEGNPSAARSRHSRTFCSLTDDHVGRKQQTAQSPTQPYRLVGGIRHLRLDHQEVRVAVPAGLAREPSTPPAPQSRHPDRRPNPNPRSCPSSRSNTAHRHTKKAGVKYGSDAGSGEPTLVLKLLGDALAVDRRHRVDREPETSERLGKMPAAEASVDEELRRPGRRGLAAGRCAGRPLRPPRGWRHGPRPRPPARAHRSHRRYPRACHPQRNDRPDPPHAPHRGLEAATRTPDGDRR